MEINRVEQDVSPEVIAGLLNRLAENKAAKMRMLAKATVVMVAKPEWLRAEEVNAMYGIPANQLLELIFQGKIIAKKLDRYKPSSAVIYSTESIEKAIGELIDYREWLQTRPDKNNTKKGE